MIAGKRAEIATALSTVDGVTGYDKRPKVYKAGGAWALLDSMERGPGLSFGVTWRVMLCLGGDELTAERKTDEWLPAVAAALNPIAYVQSARTVVVKTEAGDMFALELLARSE